MKVHPGYRRIRLVLVALVTGVAPLLVDGLDAQASISARAEMTDIVLSILPVRDLQFGTVIPGVATTVDPQSSLNVGKVEIRGAPRAEITVDFTLPVSLTVGPWTMPISFGAGSACHRNRDQQAQCSYFDPSVTLTTTIRNRAFPDNLRMIWIGGTVSPAAGQFPGVYRGTVTTIVAYTGN